MSKIQEPRGDDNIVDTDTELEHDPVHDTKEVENTIKIYITTVIYENIWDKEGNDEKIFECYSWITNIIERSYCYWYRGGQ